MKGYAICKDCDGVMIVERADSNRPWIGNHCNALRCVETKDVIMATLTDLMSEKEIREALDFLGD